MWSQSAVWFYNWTDEEFTYPWGGEKYTFKPKERMRFPIGIAYHFAKHLAEHMFNGNKRNITYNIAQLDEYIDKGLIKEDAITGVSDEKMRIMAMNSKSEIVSQPAPEIKHEAAVEAPKKKRGRPAKKDVEVKSDLEGFAGK